MVIEHKRVESLFHLCVHSGRTHMCACDLAGEHSDVEWDNWYAEKEKQWKTL